MFIHKIIKKLLKIEDGILAINLNEYELIGTHWIALSLSHPKNFM